jgi:hypothetical protein
MVTLWAFKEAIYLEMGNVISSYVCSSPSPDFEMNGYAYTRCGSLTSETCGIGVPLSFWLAAMWSCPVKGGKLGNPFVKNTPPMLKIDWSF